MSTPSNFAKVATGDYVTASSGDNSLVRVNDDGSILISPKAYVDDVGAFCYGAIRSNPTISDEIKNHLARFIDDMDVRALTRHGYSHSCDEERTLVWKQISSQ